jgi:uncharacterized membrane protein
MGSTLLKLYLPALVVFLILDALWLGVVARGFYREQFGDLMRPDIRWGAALLFYLLFIAAVLVFVVMPALERGSLGYAIGMGAFFGLVAYATYDLTNLAVLRGFPTMVAVVDMAWGAVVTASTSAAAFLLASKIGLR